jgi:hypothetical protein
MNAPMWGGALRFRGRAIQWVMIGCMHLQLAFLKISKNQFLAINEVLKNSKN